MTQKNKSYIHRFGTVLFESAKEFVKPENLVPMIALAVQLKVSNYLIDSAMNKSMKLLSKKEEIIDADVVPIVPARKKRA